MIDPYDFDNKQDYLETMADEFGISISDILTMAEIHGAGNMGWGIGITAELYFHLDDFRAVGMLTPAASD